MGSNARSASSGAMPSAVADQLRREIVEGLIEPGERINVRKLGQRLEVSAIPIREAIRLLESEGLVETIPNTGAVVARVSLEEVKAVYDLRRLIEPAIARRSAANMSDDHTDRLRKTLHELEVVERETEGMDGIISTHRRFHWELLEPGATPLVEDTIRRLWRISERYVALTRRAALPVADAQHAHMVELCIKRDGDGLADLLAYHLHLAADTVITLFSQDTDAKEAVRE
jgi:DNA-binding GntR family transcriptional regulator